MATNKVFLHEANFALKTAETANFPLKLNSTFKLSFFLCKFAYILVTACWDRLFCFLLKNLQYLPGMTSLCPDGELTYCCSLIYTFFSWRYPHEGYVSSSPAAGLCLTFLIGERFGTDKVHRNPPSTWEEQRLSLPGSRQSGSHLPVALLAAAKVAIGAPH